jgi:hypothetical protein
MALHEKLEKDQRYMTAFAPELDIVVFAPRAKSISDASGLSRRIFAAAAKRNLHLALAELPADYWASHFTAMEHDRETMTCLRSVLMKPEHLDWIGQIWDKLSAATTEALSEDGTALFAGR